MPLVAPVISTCFPFTPAVSIVNERSGNDISRAGATVAPALSLWRCLTAGRPSPAIIIGEGGSAALVEAEEHADDQAEDAPMSIALVPPVAMAVTMAVITVVVPS
jgi:hypothetical protein